VPQYITVLVASSVTKSGSVISGNITRMVVVKTEPGYGPAPGKAGTGTVVSVVCPQSASTSAQPSFWAKAGSLIMWTLWSLDVGWVCGFCA